MGESILGLPTSQAGPCTIRQACQTLSSHCRPLRHVAMCCCKESLSVGWNTSAAMLMSCHAMPCLVSLPIRSEVRTWCIRKSERESEAKQFAAGGHAPYAFCLASSTSLHASPWFSRLARRVSKTVEEAPLHTHARTDTRYEGRDFAHVKRQGMQAKGKRRFKKVLVRIANELCESGGSIRGDGESIMGYEDTAMYRGPNRPKQTERGGDVDQRRLESNTLLGRAKRAKIALVSSPSSYFKCTPAYQICIDIPRSKAALRPTPFKALHAEIHLSPLVPLPTPRRLHVLDSDAPEEVAQVAWSTAGD